MLKLLLITPLPIHDKVGNAGAKTVNYYVKNFISDDNFDVTINYVGDYSKDFAVMCTQYNTTRIISGFKRKSILQKSYNYFQFHYVYPLFKIFNPKYFITNNFTAKRLKTSLGKLKTESTHFDIIIVEFTPLIFWIKIVSEIFPNSFKVASCHDVSFLLVQRSLAEQFPNNLFSKFYFLAFKKTEVNCLNNFNLVVTHNFKDRDLLEKEKPYRHKNTFVISPYYDIYPVISCIRKSYVVFFGAMSRPTNISAVQWFLENVWNIVSDKFEGRVTFLIVGGGLPENKKSEFERYNFVEIAGFVTDPSSLFNRSFCSVVPLISGGGIKVKVLEAMASGVPVITNNVGIEGIPATDGFDYIHAETPNDYIDKIISLEKDIFLQKKIGENAVETILSNFNMRESFLNYKALLIDLLSRSSSL